MTAVYIPMEKWLAHEDNYICLFASIKYASNTVDLYLLHFNLMWFDNFKLPQQIFLPLST